MNKHIVQYILFPLQELLKGRKTFRYLSEVEETQWYSSCKIKELQFSRVKKLLEHAYKTVPFYRNRMDDIGIRPDDIKDFNDYKNLPYLTKDDIRNNRDLIISSEYNKKKLIKYSTGGSSGEPLLFYFDADRVAYITSLILRDRMWWGVSQFEKELMFWGSPIELDAQGFLRNLRDRLLNTKLLSFFDVTEKSLFQYLSILRSYKPRFMYGYASAFYLFSEFLRAKKISIKNLGIKVIFTTAEMLYDYQRKVIEETFNCPVAVEYGSRDGGFIAQECPQKRMHINAEGVYVEIRQFDQTEGNGEIIVTNFNTYPFPFIRYKTGDIGGLTDEQCLCGRGLPILKSIDGRATDFLVNKDGRIIHALGIIYVFREIEGVKKFRVHQKETQLLQVKLVTNDLFDNNKSMDIIINKIKRLFGHNVNVDIQIVNDIPMSKSGKYNHVTSDIVVQYFSERKRP